MNTTYYVSLDGNDNWSGQLAEPDSEGVDGPFRTIARAQQEIRKIKSQTPPAKPIQVILRGGVYALEEPLSFTADDSGSFTEESWKRTNPELPISYLAFAGETPVISGGRRITGWREEQINGKKGWVVSIPEVKRGEWNFTQLFVNGSRRWRPRLPKQGCFRIAEVLEAKSGSDLNSKLGHGSDRFVYEAGDLKPWHNLQDVEVTILIMWETVHLKIKELDESKQVVIFDRDSQRQMTDDFSERGTLYFVENAFEALEEPGQWYLDRPEGKLYYIPLPGEKIEEVEVIAPVLSELLRIEDDEEVVQCLRFEELSFAYTEWQLPLGMAALSQGATQASSVVTLRNAQYIHFDNCKFEHLGSHAIGMPDNCLEVIISGCKFHDLGGGAIMIRDNCCRNTLKDCEIGEVGRVFQNSAAVIVGKSSGNKIVHNHIHDGHWMGISIGWTWGYGESKAYGNIIEYNYLHHLGMEELLSDIGAIYTLGVSPGTRIRYNVIHDVRRRIYGGWGIYLDEGSTDILVESNLVYRAQTSGFHQHYGHNNVIRNNIFALNTEQQVERTRQEDHCSFSFIQNIVYANGVPIVVDKGWRPDNVEFSHNLYFDASGTGPNFAGNSFEVWQASGLDEGSVINDPLFLGPLKGDFRLQSNSPAFALGFKDFDLTTVGPRHNTKHERKA